MKKTDARSTYDPDEPTGDTLQRIRAGDPLAREQLMRKYLPILRRWAHGRLPIRARSTSDTDDIVQITLFRAVEHIREIRASHSGAFLAYLRNTLLNHVRDELRRTARCPEGIELDDELPDTDTPSLLEEMIGLDRLRLYEGAVARLPTRQQELVVLRLEFGLTYQEIAVEAGGTADAVRMMLSRALSDIARYMDDETRP